MTTNSSNFGSTVIGEMRLFYSKIVVPQFLLLLALIVAGVTFASARGAVTSFLPSNSLSALLLQLLVIASIFSLNVYYQETKEYLTLKLLQREYILLSMVLLLGSPLVDGSLLASFFTPLSLCVACLAFINLRLREILYVTLPTLVAVCLMIGISSVFRLESTALFQGAGIVCFGLSLSIFINYFKDSSSRLVEPLTVRADDEIINLGVEEQIDLVTQSTNNAQVSHYLGESMVREFQWRFTPISVIVGAATLFFAITARCSEFTYYISWLGILMIQAVLVFRSARQNSLIELQSLWLLGGCGLFIWWMNAYVYGVIDLHSSVIGLLLIMLSLSSVPWIKEFNIGLSIAFLVFAASHIVAAGLSVSLFVIDAGVIVYCLYRNARHYIRFVSAALLPRLLSNRNNSVDSKKLVWNLAESLRLLGDANRILVAYDRTKSVILGRKLSPFKEIDPLFLQGLIGLVKETGSNAGILQTKLIGRQFDPALFYWFGELPSFLYYSRVTVSSEESEEVFYLFLPISYTLKIAGIKEFQDYASGFLMNLGEKRIISKNIMRSSQFVVSPQKNTSVKDDDLNHLIHLVNNAAQDLSIVVESSRSYLDELKGQIATQKDQIDLNKFYGNFDRQVSYLDGTLRSLSAAVSDIKWLREVAEMKKVASLERINILSSLEDIAAFARFKLHKSGAKVDINLMLDTSVCILAVSREFLEASLRVLIKAMTRNFEVSDLFRVKAWVEKESLIVQFSDTTPQKGKIEDYFIQGRDIEALRAIKNFAILSEANLNFSKGIGEIQNIVEFKFRLSSIFVEQSPQSGWILLVDDKAEIVSFYSSIAEALGLSSGSATTLKKAQELLSTKGQPTLVITDLQLDQESGLDLVRDLRDKYGNKLPIIVVSGNIEDNLKDQIYKAGASKYLTKPVGRRKLFFEIKELLNSGN